LHIKLGTVKINWENSQMGGGQRYT